MKRGARHHALGFTLIESLVTIALVVILLAIGVPSYNDYIIVSRLKSVNAQLVTDLQYARSEALAKNIPVYFSYRNVLGTGGFSCYIIYSYKGEGNPDCECDAAPGARCTAGQTELKTVQILAADMVRFSMDTSSSRLTRFAFDNVTGGLFYDTFDFVTVPRQDQVINTFVFGDTSRMLKTSVTPGGRPSVCSKTSKLVNYPLCP